MSTKGYPIIEYLDTRKDIATTSFVFDWVDITNSVQSFRIQNQGFQSPRSPNAALATCQLVLNNDSRSFTMPSSAASVWRDGIRIRVRTVTPTLGYCLKTWWDQTATGAGGPPGWSVAISGLSVHGSGGGFANNVTVTYEARAQWDSTYNTDLISFFTNLETLAVRSATYTNKWQTYTVSVPVNLLGPASAASVFFAPSFGTVPSGSIDKYRYVEYRNVHLYITGQEPNNGTTWTFPNGSSAGVTSAATVTGTYQFVIQRDSFIDWNGVIADIEPTAGQLGGDRLTAVNSVDMLSAHFATAQVEVATQNSITADVAVKKLIAGLRTNPAARYYNAVRDDGPSRYYRLDDSGGTAADLAMFQTGTLVGTVTTGQSSAIQSGGDTNASMLFGGGNIACPAIDIVSKSFSVECWLYFSSAPVSYGYLFTIATAQSGTQFFRVYLYSSSVIIADFYSGGNVISAALATSTWHHVVVSYDANTLTLRLYVDNVLTSNTGVGPFTGNATPTVQIGNSSLDSHPFSGFIDEVAVYPYPLSAAQVANHYTAGTNFDHQTAMSWLPGSVLNTCWNTFPMVFDTTTRGQSNALAELDNLVVSEFGEYWLDPDGTLRFGNFYSRILPVSSISKFTLSDTSGVHMLHAVQSAAASLVNRCVFSVRPRNTSSTLSVLGKTTGVIHVPAASGSTPGTAQVTVPFVGGAGEQISGTGFVLPLVAGTDFNFSVWPSSVSTNDQTNNVLISIGVVSMNGSDITFRFTNQNNYPLYCTYLQVRGYAVTTYNATQVTKENRASQITYHLQKTETRNFPYLSNTIIAASIADWYVNNFADPIAEADEFRIENSDQISGIDLSSLYIMDTITVTDAQTGLSAAQHYIRGRAIDWGISGQRYTFRLARRDDTLYAIFGSGGTYDDGSVYYA